MNEFRLATGADLTEMLALSALPVPGNWIDLSYPRCFEGSRDQLLIGRSQGQLAAMAVRATPQLWRGGRPHRLGYLGGLRVAPRLQGRNLLAEGFALLRRLHEQDPVEEYLATIVEGNQLAHQLLVERARPSWPRFFPAGVLCTLALETRPGPIRSSPIEHALSCLEWGRTREFFPCEPLEEPGERRLWLEEDGMVGALRDLSASRQTLVHGYHGPLRWLRPVYNVWQRLRRRPPLPAPGSPIRGGYLGYLCSDGYRPASFWKWLQSMLGLGHSLGLQWIYLGLSESSPYLRIARRFRHRLYRSQVFRVRYQGQPTMLTEGEPYLELAWL
ncbi:hypothetical protein JST97_15305 [bacterium]|nr:hypothetical protein [bacterium]